MTKLEFIRSKLDIANTPAEEMVNHAIQRGVQFDYAVTLTFPNKPFDHTQAERIFGVFMHYLNERCYRRAYKSGKRRINVFAIQEGLRYKRNHYHCAFEKPQFLSDINFWIHIYTCWGKATGDKLAIVDIKNYYSIGWLKYITKEIGLLDNTGISEHCYL